MSSVVAEGYRTAFRFVPYLCSRLIFNCTGLICPWPGTGMLRISACLSDRFASHVLVKIEVPGRLRNCDATRPFTCLTASRLNARLDSVC